MAAARLALRLLRPGPAPARCSGRCRCGAPSARRAPAGQSSSGGRGGRAGGAGRGGPSPHLSAGARLGVRSVRTRSPGLRVRARGGGGCGALGRLQRRPGTDGRTDGRSARRTLRREPSRWPERSPHLYYIPRPGGPRPRPQRPGRPIAGGGGRGLGPEGAGAGPAQRSRGGGRGGLGGGRGGGGGGRGRAQAAPRSPLRARAGPQALLCGAAGNRTCGARPPPRPAPPVPRAARLPPPQAHSSEALQGWGKVTRGRERVGESAEPRPASRRLHLPPPARGPPLRLRIRPVGLRPRPPAQAPGCLPRSPGAARAAWSRTVADPPRAGPGLAGRGGGPRGPGRPPAETCRPARRAHTGLHRTTGLARDPTSADSALCPGHHQGRK
ncbi:translation initiation factor IF-2-like [Meles meles]|uniref:translation initiation factor IF-2-like n=1 Tax=Meles meles TaxID=9662 RepID=UPI001E69F731|nr:translation initiation factor IF-2-like [Meles meles]